MPAPSMSAPDLARYLKNCGAIFLVLALVGAVGFFILGIDILSAEPGFDYQTMREIPVETSVGWTYLVLCLVCLLQGTWCALLSYATAYLLEQLPPARDA